MSNTDVPDKARRDGPKFRRVEQRRRFALAKFYGMGNDGEWEVSDIADELRVSESTVKNYLYDSDMGDQVREMFPAAEERMKMDILLDKKERLEKLRELFEDKLEEKDVSVTSYEIESLNPEASFENMDGLRVPEGEDTPSNQIRLDAPVPKRFSQRSKFDGEARAILREIRKHENDIRDMLSLDEPDEVHTEHHGDAVVEQKVYDFGGADSSLPDTEVVDVEAEVVDEDSVSPDS